MLATSTSLLCNLARKSLRSVRDRFSMTRRTSSELRIPVSSSTLRKLASESIPRSLNTCAIPASFEVADNGRFPEGLRSPGLRSRCGALVLSGEELEEGRGRWTTSPVPQTLAAGEAVAEGLATIGRSVVGLVVEGLATEGLGIDGLVVDGRFAEGLVAGGRNREVGRFVDGFAAGGLDAGGLLVDGLAARGTTAG